MRSLAAVFVSLSFLFRMFTALLVVENLPRTGHVLPSAPGEKGLSGQPFPHLPPDFDCRSRFLQAAGLRWHYVDEGPGETLLMLHGNPTWSYLYRHLIAGLRDAYRCVAPDLPGFGLSEKPPGADYDLRVQAQRLAAFPP